MTTFSLYDLLVGTAVANLTAATRDGADSAPPRAEPAAPAGSVATRQRLRDAQVARDSGMAEALDHAEREVTPSWGDVAVAYVRLYATRHPSLTSEDVRAFAAAGGFANPPDGRAWGSVMRRASTEKIVYPAGFVTAKDPKVHAQPIRLWKSLLYKWGGARSTTTP